MTKRAVARDDDEKDDEDRVERGVVFVERLASISGREMYRFVDQSGGALVASLALLPPANGVRRVPYALWFPEDVDEPGRGGEIERGASPGAWDDTARSAVLKKIFAKERRALERDPDQVVLRIGSRDAPDAEASDDDDDLGD